MTARQVSINLIRFGLFPFLRLFQVLTFPMVFFGVYDFVKYAQPDPERITAGTTVSITIFTLAIVFGTGKFIKLIKGVLK